MPSPAARTFALIIGIDGTPGASPGPAAGAADNARAFAERARGMGCRPENCAVLLNEKAARRDIERETERLLDGLGDGERLWIYFAGRGLARGESSYLLAGDSRPDDLATALPLAAFFRRLARKKSVAVAVFFDLWLPGRLLPARESGSRRIEAEDLAGFFGGRNSRVGFASCRAGECSLPSRLMAVSPWTFELLRALGGAVPALFEDGRFLRADALAAHLAREVPRRLEDESPGAGAQTPAAFGGARPRLIVADLGAPAAEPRPALRLRALQTGVYSAMSKGFICDLPGFRPERHVVPRRSSPNAEALVALLAGDQVAAQARIWEEKVRQAMGWAPSDLKSFVRGQGARLRTPRFEISIQIDQIKFAPAQFRQALEVSLLDPAVVFDAGFNRLFDGAFSHFAFPLLTPLDVDWLAVRIHREANPAIARLDTTDPKICRMRFKGQRGWTLGITKDRAKIKMKRGLPRDFAAAMEYSAQVALFGQFTIQPLLRA